MNSILVSSMVFAGVFGGALAGMALRRVIWYLKQRTSFDWRPVSW